MEIEIICQHVFAYDGHIKYCTKCFEYEDNYLCSKTDYKNPQAHVPLWRRDHDRNRFTTGILSMLHGEEEDDLGLQIWECIIKAVPETYYWVDVFNAFKHNVHQHKWLLFGWFVDTKIVITPAIFKECENFSNTFNCSYRFNYLYLLYKFTQILAPGTEHKVPLKLSVTCLQKTDLRWHEICNNNGLPFRESKQHTSTFNKKVILKKLIHSRSINKLSAFHHQEPCKKMPKKDVLPKNQKTLCSKNGKLLLC